MRKRLLGLAGIAMIGFARQIVAVSERVAFRNPHEAVLRRTTIPIARLEGLIAVTIARRGRWPRAMAIPMGLTGAAMILSPNVMLQFGLALAYREPDRIEPRSWVAPATRLVGISHLVFARHVLRKRYRPNGALAGRTTPFSAT